MASSGNKAVGIGVMRSEEAQEIARRMTYMPRFLSMKIAASARVVSDDQIFELWDGGHCFLRAKRDESRPEIVEFLRMTASLGLEDICLLGAWAESVFRKAAGDGAQ